MLSEKSNSAIKVSLPQDKADEDNRLKAMADDIVRKHGCNLVLSLGDDGAYLAEKAGSRQYKAFACETVNTTGCGDALLAGIAYGLYEGKEIKDAVKCGLAASSICIEAEGAISHNMTADNIEERINGGKR